MIHTALLRDIPPNMQVHDSCIDVLDQTQLPQAEKYVRVLTLDQACSAIHRLQIRGAPAIAIFAAHHLAISASEPESLEAGPREWLARVEQTARTLEATRPTAINLQTAMRRMVAKAKTLTTGGTLLGEGLRAEAALIHSEDRELCSIMATWASGLIPSRARVMTVCHTGALATGGIGTALGAFHTAHAQRKELRVFACETRPLLQGARLTTWELQKAGVPVTLITDGMAGHIMQDEQISLVMVGADRIARNGDTANKIGTFGLAILARHFKIPFYVVAPSTSLDLKNADGRHIPIEERDASEVRTFREAATAPESIPVRNPAFDVTPGALITAFVTESGVHRPPYDFG